MNKKQEISLNLENTSYLTLKRIVDNYTFNGKSIKRLPKELETYSQRRTYKSALEIRDKKHLILPCVVFRNEIAYAAYTRRFVSKYDK